ncbi:MAG: serine/threonine-protein kinase, partial [Rhodobacteraceae bacterium]|nr:serine/threonine-protein kinase [Paracoccaceae bacterium]
MAQQKAVQAHAEEQSVVDELQPGTKLLKGQYTITRFLNNGGFGITYLAKDSLNRDVVIKECFPNAFCRRSKATVAARSRAHQADLRLVVELFVREAHNLAKLVHPNIVAVHQVFEDNRTAYMAIDYIDGQDLLEVIEGKGKPLSPSDVVRITEKMLSAVDFIHQNNVLHRDISPDNILISKTGEPILIDFGAAREQASKKSRALTALRVVKDGYSPQEFYIAGSEQGPWSDLYALGASLYHLISGNAPVNAQARLAALAENREDPHRPLVGRFEGYPPKFLEAIDAVMNPIPKKRLQTASEWLAFWSERPAKPVVTALAEVGHLKVVSDSSVILQPRPEEGTSVQDTTPQPTGHADSMMPKAAPTPDSTSRMPLYAGIAAAVVIAGLAFAFRGGPGDRATGENQTVASAEVPAQPETTATPQAGSVTPVAAKTPTEPVAEAAKPAAAPVPTGPVS